MKVIKYFPVVVFLLIPNLATADYFRETFAIQSIMPSTLGIHIDLDPAPTQCTGSWWGHQLFISKDRHNYKVLSAAILFTYMSDKQITAVHYDEVGDGHCDYGNWLSMRAFRVLK